MSFELRFHKAALNEWKKLDSTLREHFKVKLAERLENPRIPSAALSGMPNCYIIKLQRAGYREGDAPSDGNSPEDNGRSTFPVLP